MGARGLAECCYLNPSSSLWWSRPLQVSALLSWGLCSSLQLPPHIPSGQPPALLEKQDISQGEIVERIVLQGLLGWFVILIWLSSRQPIHVNEGAELAEACQLLAGILTIGPSDFLICGVRWLEKPHFV